MTAHEVIAALKTATQALEAYRKEKRASDGSAASNLKRILESRNDEQIEESLRDLTKQAYEVGLSGQTCPTCGGTGKV